MKSYTEHLTFTVPKRMDFVNITSQVEAIVAAASRRALPGQCDAHHGQRVHQRR